MSKFLIYLLIALAFYQLFNSCASPSSPTGGPRDTIPPVLTNSIPLNQTINYNDRTITMEFDERIKITKLKEQLIITPFSTSKYEFIVKKNIFKITFDEPFNENTTYTINFRESIQDLTEGNPTRNNKLTFSTGEYIDSLSITGYVKELLTYDTLKNIFVGLYRSDDTITIHNGSPYYFTEVSEKGKYLIENVKNGKYMIYAFEDDNKNLKLETNKEAYAFLGDTLTLDSLLTTVNLDLIRLDITDFKRMSALPSGKYYEINFNKYIYDYEIYAIDKEHPILSTKAKENKSIRVYNNFDGIDSLRVAFHAKDSINNAIEDTVYVKFTESRRKTDELNIQLKPVNKAAISPSFTAEVKFNKPIISYNTDSILIRYDTTILHVIHDSTFNWSKFRNELNFSVTIDKAIIDTLNAQKQRINTAASRDTINVNEQQQTVKKQASSRNTKKGPTINQGLQLYFGKGAFISADIDTSSSFGNNYKFIVPSDFGTQKVIINSAYNYFTVQLIKENFEVIQEYKNEKNYSLQNIEPGKYKIRVLIDRNEDGTWNPGNMKEQIEPEPVYIYPDALVIRADWETSVTLTF